MSDESHIARLEQQDFSEHEEKLRQFLIPHVAAGRRWWWAVAYALVLESFMIMLYPGWLGFSMNGEFLTVSITAHLTFGAVLGVLAARVP